MKTDDRQLHEVLHRAVPMMTLRSLRSGYPTIDLSRGLDPSVEEAALVIRDVVRASVEGS